MEFATDRGLLETYGGLRESLFNKLWLEGGNRLGRSPGMFGAFASIVHEFPLAEDARALACPFIEVCVPRWGDGGTG
jgi:hypothetical protein